MNHLSKNPPPSASDGFVESSVHLAREREDYSPTTSLAQARQVQFTAPELWDTAFEPLQYIIPGLLVPGLTILAGAPKLGKSWLALDIGAAVAMDGYCFGDRKAQYGDVLYCALEDNARRLQDRLKKVCWRKPGPNFTVWLEMPALDVGGIEALREWIQSVPDPRLVVIDVFNKVRPQQDRGEAPYAYDYRSIGPLQVLAAEFNISILVVHHVRKMGADDALERVSGTNGLTGAADSILILSRDTGGVTLSGRGRDITEFEYAVEFQKDNCRWHILGDAHEVSLSAERRKLLDAMRAAKTPMGPRQLHNETGISESSVQNLLIKMAASGDIHKVAYGKYEVSINPHETNETDESGAFG